MRNKSLFLEKAMNLANAAFDAHCKQWDQLQAMADPTIEDMDKWLCSRNAFWKAQDEFEDIVRQISGGNTPRQGALRDKTTART